MTSPARPYRMARLAFAGFALLLFTMTHWPKLRVPGPIPRGDLYVHAAAFFTWTSLLIASALVGPRALAPRNIWLCLPLAIAYAGLDELTQAIPILNRTCAWDDFGADAAGVLLATLVALLWSRRRAASTDPSTSADDPAATTRA